jgi:hypothetical protein
LGISRISASSNSWSSDPSMSPSSALPSAGHADGPRAIAGVALDLAQDGRDRVAGKADATFGLEPVDRLDETDRRAD